MCKHKIFFWFIFPGTSLGGFLGGFLYENYGGACTFKLFSYGSFVMFILHASFTKFSKSNENELVTIWVFSWRNLWLQISGISCSLHNILSNLFLMYNMTIKYNNYSILQFPYLDVYWLRSHKIFFKSYNFFFFYIWITYLIFWFP